jgi:hypothetical protein
MSQDETHLMAAKICHDLATPLSAMNLLLDLAFEKCTDPNIEATFRESVEKASIRIQFYRLFLSINPDQPNYSDVYTLILNYSKLMNVHVDMPIKVLNGKISRLLLGLSYILIDGLIRGGRLKIIFENENLRLEAEGSPTQLRPGYREALETGDEIEVNARNILPVYLCNLAKTMNMQIQTQRSEGYVVFQTTTLS